ncbi:MAG: transcriptional regulator with XRE-family HTH domain [Candidatus Omnitrophota bacterium]|jgi:transcriptional regulator with XRE-family HTH domain
MKLRKIFGKAVRTHRIKKDMTQLELAEKADIQYKYLQRIEGKNPPAVRIDMIETLSKALDTTPKDMV